MATNVQTGLEFVKSWYVYFERRDIDWVVSSFTEDAIVTVGAGDSAGTVPYGGRFVGTEQIRYYYTTRFLRQELNPAGVIRPLCGMTGQLEREFDRWILIGGDIEDQQRSASVYRGKFLHVWSLTPERNKIASLDMYFDVAAAVRR